MKTFIIAEAGVNHNGDIELAKTLIDIAVESGADAVKFQTYKTHQLVTQAAPKAEYQLNATERTETQYEMLKKLELSPQQTLELFYYARDKKIIFMSSPFDCESLTFLTEDLDLPIIKIASGEITNAPLILAAAQSQKKMIISTGMSTLDEIEFALKIAAFGYLSLREPSALANVTLNSHFLNSVKISEAQKQLKENITLLHCTTNYPASYSEVNLRAMQTLKEKFLLPVGYSDHTLGIEIAIAAVSLGATVIEKHYTLDKKLSGPDHQASLNPVELNNMIASIRHLEVAMGDGQKQPTGSEQKNKLIARKSLVALKPILPGEIFTKENLGLKRPGGGIPGIYYWDWLGKTSQHHYMENEFIQKYEN